VHPRFPRLHGFSPDIPRAPGATLFIAIAQLDTNEQVHPEPVELPALFQSPSQLAKAGALIKALEQWQHKKQISDQEAKLKIDFVRKYGAKEWEALLRIKLDIENMERKNNEEFQHDLKAVRRVQFYCFAAAAVVAWYVTWGYKI
jgi:hypothetical protein